MSQSPEETYVIENGEIHRETRITTKTRVCSLHTLLTRTLPTICLTLRNVFTYNDHNVHLLVEPKSVTAVTRLRKGLVVPLWMKPSPVEGVYEPFSDPNYTAGRCFVTQGPNMQPEGTALIREPWLPPLDSMALILAMRFTRMDAFYTPPPNNGFDNDTGRLFPENIFLLTRPVKDCNRETPVRGVHLPNVFDDGRLCHGLRDPSTTWAAPTLPEMYHKMWNHIHETSWNDHLVKAETLRLFRWNSVKKAWAFDQLRNEPDNYGSVSGASFIFHLRGLRELTA